MTADLRIKDGVEYVPLTPAEIDGLRKGNHLFVLDSLAVIVPTVFESHSRTGGVPLGVWINGRLCGALEKHLYRMLTFDRDEFHEVVGYDS
jgi:hypothetical protein